MARAPEGPPEWRGAGRPAGSEGGGTFPFRRSYCPFDNGLARSGRPRKHSEGTQNGWESHRQ